MTDDRGEGVRAQRFGVYVHIPFCSSRCGYCDFATWTDRAHLVEDYVDACVTDLTRRFADGALPPATSVFFGGGTPSLLPAAQLTRILDAIPRAPGAEVTVECNPDSVDLEKLTHYCERGVNRISIGAQSMQAHVLATLERAHDPGNVARAVRWAREAGMRTFNLDLIYGTPGESLDDWRRTLDAALALDPPHVSAYALTLEPGTPLAKRVDAGSVPRPDDDLQADCYALADAVLAEMGLGWYEISNWARPGHECAHNLLYWDQGQYLAIGCAAHGHTGTRRWWNVRTPERYIALVAAGASTDAGAEELEPHERERERRMLALRTSRGLGADLPGALAPAGSEGGTGTGTGGGSVPTLIHAGLLEATSEGRVRLTLRGRLLANEVSLALLDAPSVQAVGELLDH